MIERKRGEMRSGDQPLKTTAPAMPREGPLAASDISWTISVNVASGAGE
jgi:hypothetical protein